MASSAKKDDEVENCEELDEDYFLSLGTTFSVVDAWNENDESDVKKEKVDEESNHSKSSSKRSSNNEFKRSTSRDNKKERARFVPERMRSPERKFKRQSPPFRRHHLPSPPRRRSPPRRLGNINGNQKSFLEELQDKLGKKDEGVEQFMRGDARINWKDVKAKQQPNNNFNRNQFPMMVNPFNQMMQQNQPMPMMMNPAMQFTGPPVNMVPQQMQFDMFANPMHQSVMIDIPQPVPPPNIMHQNSMSPPLQNLNNNNNYVNISNTSNNIPKAPVTIVRENAEPTAAKKPPSDAFTNLTDILRQKSKKNNKFPAEDKLASKKTAVLDRCKEAVNLIEDLEQNKSKVPLVCVLSKQDVEKPKNTFNKSPLLTSESNPTFMFQATKDKCRVVLEDHPLRNIYGSTAEIAQHLKFDLNELSLNVAQQTLLRHETVESNAAVPPPPSLTLSLNNSNNNINNIAKKGVSKAIQTDHFPCQKCINQERIKHNVKSNATQTSTATHVDSSTQHDTDENDGPGFRVFIDERTFVNRNFEQHHALELFAKEFGITVPDISSSSEKRTDVRRHVEVTDDRMHFANPENPNRSPERPSRPPSFFSTSPIRHRSEKRSNSPPRLRPQIFERIGDKISDHSDSPRAYDDLREFQEIRERSPFRPYKIPSPDYSRDWSPGPSRRFRNRSRSISPLRPPRRSPSRSRSRSPKRYRKHEYRFMDRRGRY